eukprot:TRINITY_DN78622_c0_g1_i1.p1 TRINITY_DN78622_c0_g1~~TRINITY_DN78622_c0_g1_i1.p1  ORF type:complete len:556 (-),score=157.24 TRINITY_DN78622_c0_g1_i1:43-1638(-)
MSQEAPEKDKQQDLVGKAQQLREEGNEQFKSNKLQEAKKSYEEALKLLETCSASALAEQLPAIRTPVQLNLALCCLRAEPCEAYRALELCEEVLHLEPDHPKATYRKAKALLELGEEKEAEWELVRACKLQPKDAGIRKDLDQLRKRFREQKEKEKTTFEGLFERSPGFASDRRESSEQAKLTKRDVDDIYFHDGKDNPFEGCERPHEEARKLQAEGQLESAAQAWEAAMGQSAAREDWVAHFSHCVDFGTLLMDINIDRLALRCFNIVFDRPVEASDDEARNTLAAVRRRAGLLKAICLINEAPSDPHAEVTECLEAWMRDAYPSFKSGKDGTALDHQIIEWRRNEGTAASADVEIALGVLQLLQGKESPAPQSFAAALRAPEDLESCFGTAGRKGARWNMLGAVLANRGRPEHAILAYQQALAYQPHYPRALTNMGIAKEALQEPLEAAACYAAALALVPGWASDELWALLQKAAAGAAGNLEELQDAARKKDLTQVRGLLGAHCAWRLPSSGELPSAAEVLAKMGLAE